MKNRKRWWTLLLGMTCLLHTQILPVEAEEYWPEGPQIAGESAIVMEASTGTVLFEKNSHEQCYPASITKIMTSMLAVKNSSLDEEVTFSKDAVYKTEGSGISRDVGEVMTMRECLYGLMLESANECGYAIAEHTGGNYDDFVKMMNDEAKRLGCKDTHFNNPHGLPDEDHKTSAYDMALISREALKNDVFRMIVNTRRHSIPPTNKHEEETYLSNHHKMRNNYKGDEQYLYEYCIGGKTGYTSVAGSTLATFAEKDGMTLICVVMRETSPNHYTDTRALFDYCFENFQLWNISENEKSFEKDVSESKIFEGDNSFAELNKEGYVVLPKAVAFEDAKPKIKKSKNDSNVIGHIQYTYAGRKVGGTDIEVTSVKIPEFKFQKEKEQAEIPEGKVVNINVKYIIIGIVAAILLVGIGFGIYHLADNFYLIRYKLESRKMMKRSFKEIKVKKHRRRR
ncbi:MAG: D-alanyl-D-alanine carboxypeptidase [Lachnospiraceae bacterium]|nr:D-alanyl-D-alanine carboxypeptidase [Lachnospiraceae bacterium]